MSVANFGKKLRFLIIMLIDGFIVAFNCHCAQRLAIATFIACAFFMADARLHVLHSCCFCARFCTTSGVTNAVSLPVGSEREGFKVGGSTHLYNRSSVRTGFCTLPTTAQIV